jgi:DNA-binding transcriptional MerR regulator
LKKPLQTSLFDFDEPPVPQPAQTPVAANPTVEPAPTALPVAPETETTPPPAFDNATPAAPVDFSSTAFAVVKNRRKNLPVNKGKRGRLSMAEMDASLGLVEVPPDEELFKKSYYSMGSVAAMFKVNQSLLRMWEKEFDVLKPKKNGKGDRFFRPEDVKNIQLIYHLTRQKKYTLQGAKDFIKNNKKADEKFALIQSLQRIKDFLLEMKAGL